MLNAKISANIEIPPKLQKFIYIAVIVQRLVLSSTQNLKYIQYILTRPGLCISPIPPFNRVNLRRQRQKVVTISHFTGFCIV